jgi:hypothetical protein
MECGSSRCQVNGDGAMRAIVMTGLASQFLLFGLSPLNHCCGFAAPPNGVRRSKSAALTKLLARCPLLDCIKD